MPNTEKAAVWRGELEFLRGGELEENLRRISGLLESMDEFLAEVPGLDPAGRADLRLVCDEIGSNVIRYWSHERDIRLVVDVDACADSVHLRVTDNGGEFNPFDSPVPYMGNDIDKRRVGGLGLYLITQLFPLARYERRDERNISRVVYHLGEGGKKKMRRETGKRQVGE